MKTPTVHLDSARGAEWEAILGTRDIPVQSPVPVLCTVPDEDKPQLGYLINPAGLSTEQREDLAAAIAEKHGIHISEAYAQVMVCGIAINARACSVSFDPVLLPELLGAWCASDHSTGRRRAA